MSLNGKPKKKCLFENRENKFKVFSLNNKLYAIYQLQGDQKTEEEMELDFINTISLNLAKKSLNNHNNGNSVLSPMVINNSTNIINNNINNSIKNNNLLNKSSINPISQIQSNRQSIDESKHSIQQSKMLTKAKSIISNNNAPITKVITDYNFLEEGPNADLLLQLYEKGMYDPQNPNHQKGTVILTQTQKEKWKIPDNYRFVHANNIKDFHPFCFFNNTRYPELVKEGGMTRYPQGKLVNYRDWRKEPDYSLKGIYGGIEVNDKVGLVIVDPNVKKKYSGLVVDIIIQLLKVPFGHHMCLNVKIFEPKCLEERLTNVFSYANRYLIPAADPSLAPYDRFKSVITFIMSGLYIPAQQLKPFNPYLGETFQGELPNGAKVYVEQVTHKPLCARFYMFYKKVYKLYGYFNFDVRSEGLGSTMYVMQQGPVTVEFPQLDERVTFNVPEIKIVNARNENGRANLYSAAMVFVDIKNNFKAVIQFDVNKKKFHEMKGCTFKCNFPTGYRYVYDVEWKFGKKFNVDKHKKEPTFLEYIRGSWITNLFIGDKLYWDVKAQIPEFIKPTKSCLPSDGRFREDLCWLWKSFYEAKNEEERKNLENISQKWKVMMEDHNRWDRKRRADYNAKLFGKK